MVWLDTRAGRAQYTSVAKWICAAPVIGMGLRRGTTDSYDTDGFYFFIFHTTYIILEYRV
jgi:hypothetical protein